MSFRCHGRTFALAVSSIVVRSCLEVKIAIALAQSCLLVDSSLELHAVAHATCLHSMDGMASTRKEVMRKASTHVMCARAAGFAASRRWPAAPDCGAFRDVHHVSGQHGLIRLIRRVVPKEDDIHPLGLCNVSLHGTVCPDFMHALDKSDSLAEGEDA
eukprot:361885-Chlamydomonas_euryale.AAC.12